MSAFDMKPKFGDLAGYRKWKSGWVKLFISVSADIRSAKMEVKRLQRSGDDAARKKHRELIFARAMGRKLMDLLQDAKARLQRIVDMQKQIETQRTQFPLVFENTTVDFHYNRASNDFSVLPMWVVKTKGKTFYVDHVTANAPWSTHERPDSSTRGLMRFRRCNLILNENNTAEIVSNT